MLKLGIRVSTISSKGKGHLRRCLAIRKNLQGKFFWFIDHKDTSLEKEISQEDNIFYENSPNEFGKLKKFITNNTLNTILIDSYNINYNDITKVKNIPTAIIIDEDIKVKANIIICSQPIKLKHIDGTRYLSGPKYAPISDEFCYDKKVKKDQVILISFGSVDSIGITLNVIQAIKNIFLNKKYDFKIFITLGKDSPIIQQVKSSIRMFTSFKLIIDSPNMKKIYSESILCIGAPGLSFLERLSVGLPSLLIAQNDKHMKLINTWVNLGCAIKASNNIKSIENNLKRLLFDKDTCIKIINNGIKIVDGKGANRIAETIDGLIKKND
jgi:spore coat polysaccharide biosynthesis predicted glycosyltransferase SpsG